MVDLIEFGKQIAKLRKERGLTGEKFAALLDVSPQAVSKWETGKNLPETVLLPSISRILGVSIDSLLVSNKFPVKQHQDGYYIDGIPTLRWGDSQDCTWAGSISILLDAIGIDISYSDIMGFSGVCYYFAMTSDWCPSSNMPQIAFNPEVILEKSIGLEGCSHISNDFDNTIKNAIKEGNPVMIIQPRVEMEWGVLCGYTGGGKFYGRSYFDYLRPDANDIFTDNDYYLADSYPGINPNLAYFYRRRTSPPSLKEALKLSLETAITLYTEKPRHNRYEFGLSAYDILIAGLNQEDEAFASITQYGATGNGIILLSHLIDARRNAHIFWSEKAQHLSARNIMKMTLVANLYNEIYSSLVSILSYDIITSARNGFPIEAWSKTTRSQLAEVLTTCKQFEQQILNTIFDVLSNW